MELTALVMTANRPTQLSRTLQSLSGVVSAVIVADGSNSPSRFIRQISTAGDADGPISAICEIDWLTRLTLGAKMTETDWLLLTPDDDPLLTNNLRILLRELQHAPRAVIAGGPPSWRNPADGSVALMTHSLGPTGSWTYNPGLFYGLWRTNVAQEAIASSAVAVERFSQHFPRLNSLTRGRLLEVSLVLAMQIRGDTLMSAFPIFLRDPGRTWHVRFLHWSGYLELEEILLHPTSTIALHEWASEMVPTGQRPSVDARHLVMAMRSYAETSFVAPHRYPRILAPAMRLVGRTGVRVSQLRSLRRAPRG
jgi:hypothetical protein